jgi:Domain of unknown function (DUF4082)
MKDLRSWFDKLFAFRAALLLLAGFASGASADNMLYTGIGFNDANNGATLGFEFTPTATVTVNALGVLDGGLDGPGLQTAHDVGLYTDTGSLLATATVDNSGTLQNGFRFAAISPVVLNASQTYVLAAYYPAGFAGDKLGATSYYSYPLIAFPGVTLGAGGSALAFPGSAPFTFFLMTANMLFTASTPLVGDGDLNFDGKVDVADILLGRHMVFGSLAPSADQLIAGDIAPYAGGSSQPDNRITLGDLLLIIRIASGSFTP